MPDEPDRDDRGQYVETLPAEEVLAFLRAQACTDPLTGLAAHYPLCRNDPAHSVL